MPSISRHDGRLIESLDRLLDPANHCVELAVRLRPVKRGPGGARIRGPLGPMIGCRWNRITGRAEGVPSQALLLDIREDALPFIEALLHGDHEVLALWGGRQAGKSVTAAIAIILLALLHPGQLVAVVSPAYPQSRSIMRRVLDRLPESWREGVRMFPPPPRISLVHGGGIEFLSAARPQSLRGETYAAILADELPLFAREAYTSIRPAGVVAGKAFRLVATGTPNSKLWVREFKRHCDEAASGARSFNLPTPENPWMAPGDLERLAGELGPYLYRQEIEGRWDDDTGLVYHCYHASQHAIDPPTSREHETLAFCRAHGKLRDFYSPMPVLVGHDWGARVMASMVVQAWRTPAGRWQLWIVDEVITKATTPERHIAALTARIGKDALIVCDASDPTAREGMRVFRQHGFRVVPVAERNPPIESRVAAVNNLLDETLHGRLPIVRIARGTFGAPHCEYLRHALETQPLVDYSDKPRARPLKGEDGRAQDVSHYADALGYLLWWLYPVGIIERPHESRQRSAG